MSREQKWNPERMMGKPSKGVLIASEEKEKLYRERVPRKRCRISVQGLVEGKGKAVPAENQSPEL